MFQIQNSWEIIKREQYESVKFILHQHLGMTKVSVRWVSVMVLRAQLKKMSTNHVKCYEQNLLHKRQNFAHVNLEHEISWFRDQAKIKGMDNTKRITIP